MIVILGDEEVANKTIALRDRREREQSTMQEEEFITLLKEKMREVHF